MYDFQIYSGKDPQGDQLVGLGERVVTKLCSTIRNKEVVVIFDRFFSSTKLFASLNFAAVGTYMTTRRFTAQFDAKLKRGESQSRQSDKGVMAVKWCDTKEVHVMSNCHTPQVGKTFRTNKTGGKTEITCPEAIVFYNKYMLGVDRSDQAVSLYNFERKSTKWWKKVFFKLMKTAIVNAWILYQQLKAKDTPQLPFVIDTAEELITEGIKSATVERIRKSGRPSK